MADINETILDLSSKVGKHFTIDKEGKAAINEHVYVDSAPEGITRESIAAHQEYRDNFVVAATHAAGLAANEVAKKHKGIDEVSFVFPLSGKDTYNLEWQRTKEVPNGIGKDAGTKTVFGHTTRGITQTSTKGGSGQMKAVLFAISDNAKELLG
jgi:hypothetical protein